MHHGEGEERDVIALDPAGEEYESYRPNEVKFIENIVLTAASWFYMTAIIVTAVTYYDGSREIFENRWVYVFGSITALGMMVMYLCMGWYAKPGANLILLIFVLSISCIISGVAANNRANWLNIIIALFS